MNPHSRLPSNRPRLPRILAASFVVVAATTNVDAGAASDLAKDAARVEKAWVGASSQVARLRPQFLAGGQSMPVLVPSSDVQAPGCVSVGVLGTRDTDFTLDLEPRVSGFDKEGGEQKQDGKQSVAGAAMLVRCGEARAELADLVIRMRSPQGALEVLVAVGASEAPPLKHLLPERDPGPLAPSARPSPPPTVAPFPTRVATARSQLVELRGALAPGVEVRADTDGNGVLPLRLTSGCHRLYAIPDAQRGDAVVAVDVDMEVRRIDATEALAQDRGFGTDATVDVCVGLPEIVQLRFAGAVPGQRVAIVHGHWDIPNAIPSSWSPRARAEIARAMLHRQVGRVVDAPLWEGLGVTGTTVVSIPVDPGGCYVFASGPVTGDVRAIRVTAQAGPRQARDGGGGGIEAGVVAICAGPHETLRVEVDSIGQRIVWVGGLWKVGELPLGTEVMQ